MNIRKYIDCCRPEAGYDHLIQSYLKLSGISFLAVFIAEALDELESAPYAAYYVGAINEAVSPKFWDLLSVSGLMFLCISFVFIYLAKRISLLVIPARYLSLMTHILFLLAFDMGAIALGILFAQFIQAMDGAYLKAWESLLFSQADFLMLLALAVLNTLLWIAGESIYNRDHHRYSGILNWMIDSPNRYTWTACGLFTGFVAYLILSQQ